MRLPVRLLLCVLLRVIDSTDPFYCEIAVPMVFAPVFCSYAQPRALAFKVSRLRVRCAATVVVHVANAETIRTLQFTITIHVSAAWI